MPEKHTLPKSPHDAGKGNTLVPVTTTDPSGVVTDIGTARLDPSGSALVPTPTNDPLDPLNWPKTQKYVCVSIVCYFYFLFTYQTTAPIPSFSLLQEQFNATYTEVNWSFAIPSLGLALGPLFCSSLADIYGRRIVMIGGTIIALVASGCTSIRGISLNGYMVARFFQGFGASPAATVGLSIINDVSFEHERGFRIGLWVMAIDLGGLCGGFSKSPAFRIMDAADIAIQSAGFWRLSTNTGLHTTLQFFLPHCWSWSAVSCQKHCSLAHLSWLRKRDSKIATRKQYTPTRWKLRKQNNLATS